jgi:hypothetical protein
MNSKWSKFVDIERATANNSPFAGQSGVYQIRAVKHDEKPILIGRLRKRDAKGIIYIGYSERRTIPRRIKLNVDNEKGYASVKHKLPKHYLQARAMRVSRNNARDIEIELLNEYRKKYGELPPFNLKLG